MEIQSELQGEDQHLVIIFLTDVASTNSITVDRSPGTVSNGTGALGGAARNFSSVLSRNNAIGDKAVPGNVIFLRGGGTSSDYTYTEFIRPVDGSGSDRVLFFGEPGSPRPTIVGSGTDMVFWEGSLIHYKFLSIKAGANQYSRMLDVYGDCFFEDVIVNSNNVDCDGIRISAGPCEVIGCEFISGTTNPTAHTNRYAILIQGPYQSLISGCAIHHNEGNGILSDGNMYDLIDSNLIYANKGSGILISGQLYGGITVSRNTIHANEGHGVSVATTTALSHLRLYNNNITNHTGSSKYGLAVLAGTQVENDSAKRIIGWNNFYGNTTNTSGVSLSSSDVSLDPEYVDSSKGNFTAGNLLLQVGFPMTYPISSIVNCPWLGAVSPEATASGGGSMVYGG